MTVHKNARSLNTDMSHFLTDEQHEIRTWDSNAFSLSTLIRRQ